MDKHEYFQTLDNILNCIIIELQIDPTDTLSSIADAIRCQSSLQCLYSILISSKSVALNKLFVNKYEDVLELLLNIVSRDKKAPDFPALTQIHLDLNMIINVLLCL